MLSYVAWAGSAVIGGHADVVFIDEFGAVGTNALLVWNHGDVHLQKVFIEETGT